MTAFVVLMYHGLYASDEEYARIPAADRPYTLSAQRFRAHLDALHACGAHVMTHPELEQPRTLTGKRFPVLISFDDGDQGWVRHALPRLKERGWQGTFFVTTDLIGSHPHFCDWNDIRTLAEAGMNIQSHGKTHRFLADLDETACREEFALSKQRLESATGQPVTTISFPGGRYRKRDLHIGREAGFRWFHTSRPGLNPPAAGNGLIRRFAIRHDTSPEQVVRLVTAHGPTLLRLRLATTIKDLLKRLLGNGGYHQLYERMKQKH